MTVQKHKDELLVENAILKYNEQVRAMLKEELAPFSRSIKELEKKISNVEIDVDELKEIVKPFVIIRKKMWFIVICASIVFGTFAVFGNELSEIIKSSVK